MFPFRNELEIYEAIYDSFTKKEILNYKKEDNSIVLDKILRYFIKTKNLGY